MPRDMFASAAYETLVERMPSAVAVLWEGWLQINYQKKSKNGKGRRVYSNGGRINLSQNRLLVLGLSVSTQVKAKKLLQELGFLDVVETGSLTNATVFVPSERWRRFPNVPPPDKPIAMVQYKNASLTNPEHPIHKRRRQSQKAMQISNEGGPTTIQQIDGSAFDHSKFKYGEPDFSQSGHSNSECLLEIVRLSDQAARGPEPGADPGDQGERVSKNPKQKAETAWAGASGRPAATQAPPKRNSQTLKADQINRHHRKETSS